MMKKSRIPCCLAAITLALPAAATQTPGIPADARYFDHARESLWQDLTGILSIRIAYEKSQSKGERQLSCYAKPDIGSTRLLDCRDLEPLSIDLDSEDSSEGAEPAPTRICGMRLLAWSEGEPVDRIFLPVTDMTETVQEAWYQVVLDPKKDRRGWILYRKPETPSVEPSTVEYQPVDAWIGSTGFLQPRRSPHAETPPVRLAPSDDSPVVEGQSPDIDLEQVNVENIIEKTGAEIGPDIFRFLGIQGPWARVEKRTPGCRSTEEKAGDERGRATQRPCVEGWLRWRDDSEKLLLLPAAAPSKTRIP